MDYQDKIKTSVSKLKKHIIITIIMIIVTTVLLHIVGGLDKENRTATLMKNLRNTSFEFTDNVAGGTYVGKILFSDGVGNIQTCISGGYAGFYELNGNFTYNISYDFWGREYALLDIDWDDGSTSQWLQEIGKNHDGIIIAINAYRRPGFSDTKQVIHTNSMLMPIFVGVVVIGCLIIVFDLLKIVRTKANHKKQLRKKEKEKLEDIANKKIKSLEAVWSKQMQQLNYNQNDSVAISGNNLFWVASNNIYEAESQHKFIQRFRYTEQSDFSVNYKFIPISQIQYFSKEGDIHYTTKISGGGGGGFSVAGAIVGGLLAGDAGAVIGSRKKIDNIESESVAHDNRLSSIRYYHEGQLLSVSYKGFDVYNYLLKKIPDKDLISIQLKSSFNTEHTSSDKAENDDEKIANKIKTLKTLFDNELISKEEYEAKRKELLNKI